MNVKVPTVVVCSLLCLAVGAVAGGVGQVLYDHYLQMRELAESDLAHQPKGGGAAGMEKKFQGGFGAGPSAKAQLVALVANLRGLTGQPLHLELTRKQKDQLVEQLQPLTELPALSEKEASQRLNRIVAILDDQKQVLQAAGVRLPGDKATPATTLPNPFANETNRQQLQELQKHLQAQ